MLRRKWPEDSLFPKMKLFDAIAKVDHGGDYRPLLTEEYRPPQDVHLIGIFQ